ncbi:hypothetical protein ACIRRI_32525 [Streptomyces mirabilis]|uniref:hypothetical protein n=1 Tax=Streptomyces mirabilis TaxID=68239 RepID=UPI0037FFA858
MGVPLSEDDLLRLAARLLGGVEGERGRARGHTDLRTAQKHKRDLMRLMYDHGL